nr:CBS domain-containing protein [Dyella sp. ASV21]
MSCPPVLCSHDATLTEIVDIMHGSGLRRLPVADPAGRLVGIVTADDALVALTQLLQQLTEVLVVEPSLKDRLVAMQSVREAGDSGSP